VIYRELSGIREQTISPGTLGSAPDETAEFTCRLVEDRRPYCALNLAQGGSLTTSIVNDFGFEEVSRGRSRRSVAPAMC
jgi:phosphoheptose isomerase